MIERDRRIKKEDLKDDNLNRLCFVGKLGSTRGSTIYLGWTKEGLPTAKFNEDELDQDARDNLKSVLYSGQDLPILPYTSVTPIEYVATETAIDYKDKGKRKTQDLISYTVKKGNEKISKISLSELTVLNSIAESGEPWQVAPTVSSQMVVEANTMYTVFIPSPDRKEAGALLFKPVLNDGSNESSFKLFVKETISRLLVLDESQKPKDRKGYLDLAAKYYKGPKAKGPLSLFISYDTEEDRQKALKAQGRFKAAGARFLRGVGLVEVSDDTLSQMENPLSYYDINKLELSELVSLASEMATILEKQLP